jgi:hypothetical protein
MSTKIIMVLDRSGSMSGLESDVIGGFNSLLAEQKKLLKEAKFTTILFDNHYEILHDNIDIGLVKFITDNDYWARGTTALLDALGKTIVNVRRHSDKNDNVLFIINTDGLENASKEYNKQQIKDMIGECKDNLEWDFIFLGANIDAFAEGGSMNIDFNFNYDGTREGTQSMYSAVSKTVAIYTSNSGDLNTEHLNNI